MTQISIPGGSGNTVTFTVTGNSATNYANEFNAAVAGATIITTLSDGGAASTVAGALNLIMSSSNTFYSLATPGQYTYAAVDTPTLIVGTAGSQTVLGGGGVSYVSKGGDNNVTFTDGNNIFFGADASGNTISGGAGSDTINTGSASDTVFSGTGNALINLLDTSGGDIAALLAGNAVVNSYGVNDTVYASAGFDPSTTGTIFGSTGELTFVGASSNNTLAVTIVGGTGTTNIFGGTGNDIVFSNTEGSATFVAGTGNETLNAFTTLGDFTFFGDTVAAEAPSITDTVIGGFGTDFFSTGGGSETFLTGTGGALFDVNDLGPGTEITIANFGAGDYVNLGGLSVADETTLLQSATVSNGNLTVTMAHGTQVEFLSVTDLTGHLV